MTASVPVLAFYHRREMSEGKEMQEREDYFDDRLFAHGIDNVAWDDAGREDRRPRTVTLRFPVEDAEPIELAVKVIPNTEEIEYHSFALGDF